MVAVTLPCSLNFSHQPFQFPKSTFVPHRFSLNLPKCTLCSKNPIPQNVIVSKPSSADSYAGISVMKEAPVNFLTDPQEGRSTFPADVMVYGWVGGKHACVDLTGVFPLVGLGVGDFIVGRAALKAASSKMVKHEKACSDNQHVFIPFAFNTFGFLAPEAVDLLKRVQKVMHSNVVSPRSVNIVFQRLNFAIQKGLAAQLVARLPFVNV